MPTTPSRLRSSKSCRFGTVLLGVILNTCLLLHSGQASSESHRDSNLSPERRAELLVAAMTLAQKMAQLTGAIPEVLPDLPECLGARHITGILELGIPTLRVTNGPVGLGQNDCVAATGRTSRIMTLPSGEQVDFSAYTDASSARATALPSALGAAASFDPAVAHAYGDLIGTEMNDLGLHVFEAPGVNIARLPVLGRNFEYFGEDPYLSGTMGTAETKGVQAKGLIAMVKHYVGNEQEVNRQTIQTMIDRQVLHEIYLLPFEMAVKEGGVAAVMCAYNYVNGTHSCENKELLTDVLRTQWGFDGYVQSDFFAVKSTVVPLLAGLDNLMPTPAQWAPEKLERALANGEISESDIDRALKRRYVQMFRAGIFDRPLMRRAIDHAAGGARARAIGTQSAVLLQNNGALPLPATVHNLVVIGKASQIYAQQAVAGGSRVGKAMGSGGGSSDVVPAYTVAPVAGIAKALEELGNVTATVRLILVDDDNATATIDGRSGTFANVMAEASGADAVIVMAGTVSEEGADRASFTASNGLTLAASAAAGSSLDWYVDLPNTIATVEARGNTPRNSNTVAMIRSILATTSTTRRTMAAKTVLVLKDNAGVAIDPALVGSAGPAILEVWFPGQEDGNIVADLLFGRASPSGKLPVTFPFVGKGFLDNLSATQYPGVIVDGQQTVEYTEKLNVGYRWYDAAQRSGACPTAPDGSNACVAFAFGHGLCYTTFTRSRPHLTADNDRITVSVDVRNTGSVPGAEVVQVYVGLPASADAVGAAQPPKRLAGFSKVNIAAGETSTVTITIDPAAHHHPLDVYDKQLSQFVTPHGEFVVWVGNSSSPADLVKAGSFRR